MDMDVVDPRTRKRLVTLIVAGLVVSLAAGGALYFFTDVFAPPTVAFELPPSLDQLATKYPEIASVLRDPALGSAYKEFLVAYQKGGLRAAEKLASERGLIDQHRRVQVTLVLDSPASAPAVMAEAKQLGIIVEGTYDEFVEIAIPLPLIEQFARSKNPGEVFHRLREVNHVIKIRAPITPQIDTSGLFSEGVGATGADAWHKAGFTGKGVKIGVLDLGFDGYKDLLGKTLPARVTAKSFVPDVEPDQVGEPHGTKCAEVVHAMAPDAELFLVHYNGKNLRPPLDWLLSQGAQIISHSVGTMGEPMDGTGSWARFVDTIAAKNILWVNSMGNDAEAHYRAKVEPTADQWLTFPNNSPALKVTFSAQEKTTNFVLRWDDWSGNATQDLDLMLYDEKGTLVARSEDAQNGSKGDRPVEYFQLKTLPVRTYLIKVLAKRLTRPVIFDLNAYHGKFASATPAYSLGAPADARGAFSVGAIYWKDNSLESYSSRGPTTDGRVKPDLVAPARVTSFKGSFSGTSAATPHAAGAAALVWSRFPQMSANDVKAYLITNAIDIAPQGPDTETGFGRLLLPAPSVPAVAAPTALPTRISTATVAPTTLPSATVQPSPTAIQPTMLPIPTIFAPTATSIATTVAVLPSPPAPTVAPTPQAAPRPPEARSDTMAATIVLLGLLMCAGVSAVVSGAAMLVVVANKARRAVSAVSPPSPPHPMGADPPAPRAPVTPRHRSLALVGAAGQRIVMPLGVSVVGRAPDSAVHLDQPEISRQHARIFWDGERITVSDFASTNGTFINGWRLEPNATKPLVPGDEISFGGTVQWQVTIG